MPTNPIKPNILLVDDTDDDVYIFRRRLNKSGLDCVFHHVADGAQAVAFLRNAAASQPEAFPHLVFLDLKMPMMNGFEVLEWLRKQPYGAQLPIIVISGSEYQDDKDRAMQLGAVEYLVKPVKATDLERFVRDICPAKTEMGAHV